MTKIMLIEDDRTMQSLLRTLLELEKYDVIEYQNTNEGEIIQSIWDEKPDVVLMDVHFHNINCIDVLKRIRSDSKFTNIKILMSSGMAMGEQCIKSGANDFILKPYMPDELIQKIRQLQ